MNEQGTASQDNKPNSTLLPGWVILPMRLFLGVSFLAAGLDKLGDPAFLDPAAREYIGQQISGFAPGTPLEAFLLNFALPNAGLFGVMVMGGELCIGVAMLLGLLTRFSAAMGLLISLTFFLSVTWDTHPFYFGADLPYAFGWLTLLLAGPGPFALDHSLKAWLITRPGIIPGDQPAPEGSSLGSMVTRRALLSGGAAALAGSVLAAAGLGWGALHAHGAEVVAQVGPTPLPPPTEAPTSPAASSPTPEPQSFSTTPPDVATTEPVPTATEIPSAPTAPTPTVEPTQVATPAHVQPTLAPTQEPTQVVGAGQTLVAASGALGVGEALDFMLPSGQPAVLVHNAGGYSAYVAICTHQGCTVHMGSGGVLRCPCHGAQFDPAAEAKVLRGPARRPLSPVAITVGAEGAVYLAG